MPTTQTDGALERAGDRAHVRFVRRFPHPQEKVWRAITESEHLSAWFPCDVHGERAVGAGLHFTFRDDEAPDMDGEVTAFEPPRLFELTWGDDLLRFELAPDGDSTVLTFTATMAEYGKAARDGAGWHVCLERLAIELDGRDDEGPDWKPLFEHYKAEFGPEASSIGPPEGHPEA